MSPAFRRLIPKPSLRFARSKGQVIRSKPMPAVELEFGKGFKYAGAHKFVLDAVANAEQHFFVDADKEGVSGP